MTDNAIKGTNEDPVLFQWEYHADGSSDLMLGTIKVGECYKTPDNQWRVKSTLPGSGLNGRGYIAEYPWPGMAKSNLENACEAWVKKAGLWACPMSAVQ
ncbi:hypothetical protein GNM83_19225 [Salmonella enterica]|nr:hypothetical protein [Salmonella enterica]